MKQQKGFTLVEMAIVLVIIGLLLGGVLKGQELIENSKIKNAMNDIKGTQAAFNGYIDRFRQMPGDDGDATAVKARGGSWNNAAILGGNRDGVLTIAEANTFDGTAAEGVAFWQHLKAAGFIAGNAADVGVIAYPRNAFGGLIAATGNTGGGAMGLPANAKYVCMGSIPGKAARAIDVAMDDGLSNAGLLRATQGGSNATPAAVAAAYDDGQSYTICISM